MNDRFKFRAWNKLSNEMKDVISLNINYEFPECSNVILETNTFDNIKTHNNSITCANGLNNVVLMQCTGLKDKNGKLIYEGDIVEFYSQSLLDAMSCKGLARRVGQVIWNDEFLKFDVIVGNHAVPDLCKETDDNNFEIIGNIYENKDLLNENS